MLLPGMTSPDMGVKTSERRLRGRGNIVCQNAIPLLSRPAAVIKTHSVNSFLINCEHEQRSATGARAEARESERPAANLLGQGRRWERLSGPASRSLISISIVTFNSAPNCFLDCGDTFDHFSFSKMSC